MKQYEYRRSPMIQEAILTQLGLEGWELIAIDAGTTGYFKRELPIAVSVPIVSTKTIKNN